MSATDAILAWLVEPGRASEAARAEPDRLDAWWRRYAGAGAELPAPVDRAIVRGFHADRLGYAFAAGYQAALRRLLPALGEHTRVSLCITEEGGGHPRAIRTRLERGGADRGARLHGAKRWSTLATVADELLVAATTGERPDGRPALVLVRVPRTAAGLTITPMPATPFAPEVEHAFVELDGTPVADEDVLPGDAYARYIKPFRTVEDLHVHAALAAHLWRLTLALGWDATLGAEVLSTLVALRALAQADPGAPATHVALGGALARGRELVERIARELERDSPPAIAERFSRDRPLLEIAGTARARRLERAWALATGREIPR